MRENQRGFTLVEVVVAFAVLAIVAGTLLQLFVMSTKVNKRAHDVDKANALATRIQEAFREEPASMNANGPAATAPLVPGIADLQGAVSTIVSANQMEFTQYYKNDWTIETTPADAVYVLHVTRTQTDSIPTDNLYFPDKVAKELRFGTGGTYDVTMEGNASGAVSVGLLGGSPHPATAINNAMIDPLTNTVVVTIDNNGVPITSPVQVNVLNRAVAADGSGLHLDLYILDVPAGSEGLVVLTPLQGSSSYSILEGVEGSQDAYRLVVQISRISDGVVLAESTGETFIMR